MAQGDGSGSTWQREADLLADARVYLERLCDKARYRHLYPGGPNLALLLAAYQELERQRTVGRLSPGSAKRDRRYLRRLIRRRFLADVAERSLRLTYGIPLARPRPLQAPVSPLVERALVAVDADARDEVRAHIRGRPREALQADVSLAGQSRVMPRIDRGLAQLREGLIHEALANPAEIGRLHPQFVRMAGSPLPTRRQHPVARLIFVKLPIYLWLGFFALLTVAYVGAYFFVNDETLGRLLTRVIDKQINGKIELVSVHWRPSLIFDLITGQPHHATVTGLRIWEGYKKQGLEEPRHVIASTDGTIDAHLVLHEIIPWNRFLVPPVFEVPWVLHFTEIETGDPIAMTVKETLTHYPDGTEAWVIDLLEAFAPGPGPYPVVSTRAISIRIDDGRLDRVDVDLDFRALTGWQAMMELHEAQVQLLFEGLHPKKPPPIKKPLQFDLKGIAETGLARITLLGYELPIEGLRLDKFACGGDYPLGDIRIQGEGKIGGSNAVLDGWMRDVFNAPARSVDLTALLTDAGPLARIITRAHGLADKMIEATGAAAQLSFRGPFSDIAIGLAASGLQLDFFDDPALDWAIRGADLDLTLARIEVPEQWSRYVPPGDRRWIMDLAHFEGQMLGGSLRLRDEQRNHLVLGTGPERRMLMAMGAEVEGINPGEFVADGSGRETLNGRASGDVELRELVLEIGAADPSEGTGPRGPALAESPAEATGARPPSEPPPPPPKPSRKTRPKARGAGAEPAADAIAEAAAAAPPPAEASPLERMALRLDRLKIERDRGPGDDGLPRRLRIDGGVVLDREEGLSLEDLIVTVDGGTLRVDGGLDPAFASLRPTDLRLRITDGADFFKEFGLSPYVDKLAVGLTVAGPLGRPSGSNGSLQVSDVGSGQFALTDIRDVALDLDQGVLSLKSPSVGLLGGAGKLDVELGLFDGKGVSADPTLRALVDLDDVDLGRLGNASIGGRGSVRVDVGDDAGRAVPLSQFKARGALSVPRLKVGQGEFRDTEARFGVTRDGLTLDELIVRQHRQVSPGQAPDVTVPIGTLRASGGISFDDDPALNLTVTAKSLPVSAFAAIGGIKDLPGGAQIGRGTSLAVTGTMSRPSIHGTVELKAINAAGIPLGAGELELDSNDLPARDGLAARREIVVRGRFGDEGERRRNPYAWDVDAVLAIGESPRGRKQAQPPYSADVAVRFANLPLANLLRAAGMEPGEGLHGQAEGLTISARSCAPGQPLLSSCLWEETQKRKDLQILIELDRVWASSKAGSHVPAGSGQVGDPCRERTSLCSTNRLVATLKGTRVSLRDAWELRSGGAENRVLSLSGEVELSAPPGAAGPADKPADKSEKPADAPAGKDDKGAPPGPQAAARRVCAEPAASSRQAPPTGATAKLEGELALAGLSPFLSGTGLRGLDGRIGLNMQVDGHAPDPLISGSFQVPDPKSPIVVSQGKAWSVAVPKLSLSWAQDTLFASGEVAVRGQTLQFGEFGGKRTYYVLGGPCQGNFSAAATGQVDGRLLREFLPDTFASSSGGLELRDVHVAGLNAGTFELQAMRARVSPAQGGLRTQIAGIGLDAIDLTDGFAQLMLCTPKTPCLSEQEGYGVFLGGPQGAGGAQDETPATALRARVGDRGRVAVWGAFVLGPDFSRITASAVRADLDEVQYRMFDNSGRPQLYATVSSSDVGLEGRDSQTLRGEILVERGRWVRDAQEGVKVLSFADPTTAPTAPPAEIIRDMNLDLRIRTTAPFRVDNNVMKGVEGQVLLAVGGTVGDIEMSGKVDITAGVLDVAILNGAYAVQYGRVQLERSLEASTVDLLALRQEPIYIDNQPRQMYVRLGGTLDAITWRCIVAGDTRARSRTTRECVDYLVLGAGDRQVADSNVRRYGGGGLLGRPIGLVGNLTELKLNRYVQQSVPRLTPYLPDLGVRAGQLGLEVHAETPPPWFRSDWGNLSLGAGYTRGYPGQLMRNSYDWRVRFRLLDTATLEFRDNRRSYFNERIIFDPLRQRSLELRFEYQLPSLR